MLPMGSNPFVMDDVVAVVVMDNVADVVGVADVGGADADADGRESPLNEIEDVRVTGTANAFAVAGNCSTSGKSNHVVVYWAVGGHAIVAARIDHLVKSMAHLNANLE